MSLAKLSFSYLSLKTVASYLLGLPWWELGPNLWRLATSVGERLRASGMYEALDYTSTLELLDSQGHLAAVRKHEQVRYLQNDIVAFQDRIWSDGVSPLHYRVSPGRVVDRYTPGQTTIVLISLRGQRSKNEIDTYDIRWKIREGFTRRQELWQTTIYFRTRKMSIRILFPGDRPPTEYWGVVQSSGKRMPLPDTTFRLLSDGRWRLEWRIQNPKTYESYNLHWRW